MKFKKLKVYSYCKDNTRGVDLVYMQLIGKYTIGIRVLLCIIDIYSKYSWVDIKNTILFKIYK